MTPWLLLAGLLARGLAAAPGDVAAAAQLLEQMPSPYFVTAFLCWEQNKIILLSRKLFEIGLRLRVRSFSPPTIERDLPPLPAPGEAHRSVFLLDLRCAGAGDLLKLAESELLIKAPFSWILLRGESTRTFLYNTSNNEMENDDINTISESYNKSTCLAVPRALKDINALPDSSVFIITYNSGNSHWDLCSVYRRSPGGAWLVSEGRGAAGGRGLDLGGAPVRACFVLTDNGTINHLSDYRDKHIDTITKVNFVLTNHLIDIVNGSRKYSFESSWGYRDANGSWSGMIGELTSGRADIGGSPLFVTADRIPVIDYIAMTTPTRSKFVFRQPKLSYTSNVFLLPFRAPVWACCGALLGALAAALRGAARRERRRAVRAPDLLEASWSDVAVMTVGALCQQGSSVQLKGSVGRLIILLMFLSLMFLYTSYSANIVALLQSSSSRIRSLPDLLDSRLRFGVHDTVFNRYYFSTATETVRRAIYQKKIAPPGVRPRFMSLEEGVRKLREGLFAFHMEIGVGYKLVEEIFQENEKCGLQEIQYLQVVDPWLAVQKNSSYKEMFKIGFRRLQESGLQTRENWLLYTRKPRCAGGGTNFVSVGLVDCLPAILVLLYGLVISILVLIVEITSHYRYILGDKLTRRCPSARRRRAAE